VTITTLRRTLSSVNYLISLLNSNKLAAYEAASKAASDDYDAKLKIYDDIKVDIEKELDKIDN
jgi:hypothetical protein